VDAMQLTAAFLGIAARNKDETRVDYRDADKSEALDRAIGAVTGLLVRRLGSVATELLPGTVACEVCDELEVHTTETLRPGVLAFVTARCLDAKLGTTFIDAFRARSGLPVQPGDPIPFIPFPADQLPLHARKAVLSALAPRTGDPEKRADAVDRTRHLRLAPADLGQLRVRLIWADPWLDPVDTSTRFGAAATNHAAPADDFDWRRYQIGTRWLFYGVAPRDAEAQERRVRTALQEARAGRATIVVLPELCLTRELSERLVADRAFDGIPLVVAGSYHEPVSEVNGPGANVCDVFANGTHVFSHHKFSDYYYDVREPSSEPAIRYHEHLARHAGTAGFDMLISPHCAAVVLICKDAFGDVADLVQKFAPTLVLIPAMSDETADFELLAKRLAHDPQGFTLVACAGPGIHAILGRPSKERSVITAVSSEVGCEIFDLIGPVK
jgi:predicted amidohydrolase